MNGEMTDSSPEFLRTSRIVLREFTADDLELLVLLDSDPEVMQFLTGGPPTPTEVLRDRVLPRILDEYARGVPGWWIAHRLDDGEFIGWFALATHKSPTLAHRELGYRLRRIAWGHGIATEGSRALVDAAFEQLGAELVWAETMAVNNASRRVMEKAGLRYRRTEHRDFDNPIPGVEHGEVIYEPPKDKWCDRRLSSA